MDVALNPAAPSPEHLAQLDAARSASRKIRRAVTVANVDGWSVAAFAAITLVASFTSPSGILLGLGMTYVAWRELSSGAALRKLDPAAPRRLAINQIVLSGILLLYFAWCLYLALTTKSDYSDLIGSDPETQGMAGNIDQLTHEISIWIYVGLMIASALAQGGTAWYYVSREKILKQYLTTTPQWILDYQKGGGTL